MARQELDPQPDELLDQLYDAIATDGRKYLLAKFKKENPENEHIKKVNQLEITVEIPDESETGTKTDVVKVFEGYHLRDFAYSIAPVDHDTDSIMRVKLETALTNNKIKNKTTNFKSIQSLPNGSSMSKDLPKLIFESLASVQKNKSITHCLLQFLKFCYERYLPLRMFTDREALKKYIESLEAHIENDGKAAEKLPEKPIIKSNIPLGDPPYVLKSNDNGEDENEIDLNPYNLNSIPLFGRKKQLDMLNGFLKPKETLFSIMAIVGPSGAGKTRQVTEWFVENFIKNADAPQWQAGFIDSSDITPWQKWTPTCNTLIIADYIYRYDAVINEIIKKGEQSKQHHIRLLVLDHVLDSNLSNLIDDHHGQRAYGPDMSDLKSRERFVHPTLYLEEVDNRMGILQDIIAYVSGKHKESDEVKGALALIQTMGEEDKAANRNAGLSEQTPKDNECGKQAAAHPLFAALIGQALKDPEQPITHWKRQDLIYHYLSTSKRLPWAKQKDGQEADVDGEWIGAFVAAATIRRGMSFDALRSGLPDGEEYADDEFDRIKSWCCRIISSVDDEWLKPFVPDILGENFFLLFFQNFKGKSFVRDAFIKILCAKENSQENEDEPSDDIAKKYMDFVQHLTRNLANEEQNSVHVKTAWQTLAAFLNPKLYPKTSSLRLTVSFAIMAVSDILEEKGLSYLNASFLLQVNVGDLVAASESDTYMETWEKKGLCDSNESFLSQLTVADLVTISEGEIYIKATEAFTKYFDLCNETQRNQIKLQNQLNTIYLNFEERVAHISNRLIVASRLGCLNAVNFFISQHNIDINATSYHGLTALMLASKNGHEAVVALLLNEGAKEGINKSDDDGETALMLASLGGHEAVVALLLNEGAKEGINQSNKYGGTALTYASLFGREAIVALLIKAGAKSNNTWHHHEISQKDRIFPSFFRDDDPIC